MHLDLCGNDIGPDGTESLTGVLGQCASLVHLDLENNEIGESGTVSVAGVLGRCSSLTHLNLCDNDIGDVGTECLAGVLGQITVLSHLNLRVNVIGEVVRLSRSFWDDTRNDMEKEKRQHKLCQQKNTDVREKGTCSHTLLQVYMQICTQTIRFCLSISYLDLSCDID